MKVRRRARIAALQALFEVDATNHDPEVSLRGRLAETPLPPRGEGFCRSLVRGVLRHQEALDWAIQGIAQEWPIEQIAAIDRSILRLAAFEILFDGDTPPKVAINEAVELAKAFGSDSSSRFVNGVLGTLLSQKHNLLAKLSRSSGLGGEADLALADALNGATGHPGSVARP